MRPFKKVVASAFAIAFFAVRGTNAAQTPLQITSNTRITTGSGLIPEETHQWIADLLERWNSTGLSVAVVKRPNSSSLDWETDYGSYGVATGAGDLVTPDTLFAIASNSKLFLALSVGLLIENTTLAEERGEALRWNTKAKDVFGSEDGLWKLWDEDAERIVNIQDMLSHRTGLPRHDMSAHVREGGVKEVIHDLRFLRPSAEVRQQFQYNNLMYETLSYLPTLLLNQTYEDYIQQYLFDPLGMNSSTYSVEKAEAWSKDPRIPVVFADGFQEHLDEGTSMDSAFAFRIPFGGDTLSTGLGYATSKPKPKNLKANHPYFLRPGTENIWAGAGGVLTSARDLTTWVQFLLNGGRHPVTNVTVVPESVIDHVATGVTVITGKASYPEVSPEVYGAGQWRYTYQGHELVEHGGHNPGYHTQVTRYPDDNLGVIVLLNDETAYDLVPIVRWRLTEDLLGLPHVDWEGRALEKKRKREEELASRSVTVNPRERLLPVISTDAEVKSKQKSSVFSALQGTFYHPAYGAFKPCYDNKSISPSRNIDTATQAACNGTLNHPVVKRVLDSIYSKRATATDDPSKSTPDVLVSPFRGFFFTHIFLEHFDGNVFNGSFVWSNWDDRKNEGYGSEASDPGSYEDEGALISPPDDKFALEYVPASEGNRDGWAFRGNFWGASGEAVDGVDGELKDKNGKVVGGKRGAEVWFERAVDEAIGSGR